MKPNRTGMHRIAPDCTGILNDAIFSNNIHRFNKHWLSPQRCEKGFEQWSFGCITNKFELTYQRCKFKKGST